MGNMELLEDIDLKKVDPKSMGRHIENFPSLFEDAFKLSEMYSLPSYYIKAKKILMVGMGGSGQAGDIAKGLLFETDLIIDSIHNYSLPGWVDEDTLVIANSYSGNTEEVLSAFISAYQKGAKLIAITTGGKLKILAQKYRAPIFTFDYESEPRAAFPYLFTLLISVLAKLGYVNLTQKNVDVSSAALSQLLKKNSLSVSSFQNPAKILAQKIHGRIPVIYSSEKLAGVASRLKAAFNENSKNFAFSEEFPELNHKSLEGLLNPKNMIYVLSLESIDEFERNILRQNITSEILAKNKIPLERIKFIQAKDPLTEVLLMVLFGDLVSYYLALLNKANPGINDLVDYLKSRLI